MWETKSRHVTIPCANCGAAAAEITLMPSSSSGKSQALWHDRDRLERTEFIRHIYKFARYEQLEDLFEALAYNNWELCRQLDPTFGAFVCKICEEPYCDQCWKIVPAGSEGHDNHTWGTCPHDHDQIIDD
jgi:hypothetical protein